MGHDWRIKAGLALMVVAAAGYVAFLEVQASGDSDEIITSTAVWNPSSDVLTRIGQGCATAGTEDPSQCFTENMAAQGAPDDAVDFTRSYAELNHGTFAVLAYFHPLDAVDLGLAYFPSGKEIHHSWVLLNGTPAIVDINNLEQLPESELQKDSQYRAMAQQHVRAKLFPDDPQPNSSAEPESEKLPDGSQKFTARYAVRDGCRSCDLLGQADFIFYFNSGGELKTISFKSFHPGPATARQRAQ
jgi:hypothetical protein